MQDTEYAILQPTFTDFPHSLYFLQSHATALKNKQKFKVYCYAKSKELTQSHKDFISKNDVKVIYSMQERYPLLKYIPDVILGTFSLLYHLKKQKKLNNKKLKILMLDPCLYAMYVGLFITGRQSINSVSVTTTEDPHYHRSRKFGFFKWRLIKRTFKFLNFQVLSRTKELSYSWKQTLPQYNDRIISPPTLEYFGMDHHNNIQINKKLTNQFLVIGQIRKEKNIDNIKKVFDDLPQSHLNVIGKQTDTKISPTNNITVDNRFVSNEECTEYFTKCSFNVCIYWPWDPKKESGLLYQSVLHTCPLITLDVGWLGRIVKENNLGFTISKHNIESNLHDLIQKISQMTQSEYDEIINSIIDYREKVLSTDRINEYAQIIKWH